MERAPTPTNGAPLPPATPRRAVGNGYADASPSYQNGRANGTPSSRSQSRPRRPRSPARAESPDHSRPPPSTLPERSATPARTRPATPSREPLPPSSALRLRHGRMPSNADTSSRASAATTSSQVPSFSYPSSVTSVQSEPQSQYGDPRSNGYGSTRSSEARTTVPSSVAQQASPVSYTASSNSFASQSQQITPTPSTRPPPTRTNGVAPPRRENTRVSFFDTSNQATLNRVLSGDTMLHEEPDADGEGGGEAEDESAQATLESVEEMLEGYEWASDDILGRRALTGTAEQIEARLLDELMALDKVRVLPSRICRLGLKIRAGQHSFVHRVRRSNSHSPQVPR